MNHLPRSTAARLVGVVVLSSLALAAGAANWPQWRGPAFNGSSPETGLPSDFSKTKNVNWTAPMPGPSAATPVIWDNLVFVPSTDKNARALLAMCLDRESGKVRWQQQVNDGYARDERSTYASPSAVTDGKLAVFFYGNGDLAAFDVAGKKLWARNIQKDYGDFAFQWTFSASPTLYNGRLYLQVLQRNEPVHGKGKVGGESFLLALDPATGATLWRHVRPSDAVAESLEAFTTPIPLEWKGRTELLIAGGDCLTGHDPATGRELWRWGTWNPNKIPHWRLVPSPVAGGGVVLACAPKRDPIYAIKLGGSGVLNKSAVAWIGDNRAGISADVPTPLFYDGDFFILADGHKMLSRVEPATGRIKWSLPTPGRSKFEASPTGADGKIYLMNFAGDVVIVDAAGGRMLRHIPMGEPGDDMTRSSISVSQGRLFIRTNSKLFCVGQSAAATAAR
jgi:outer membrane protein assembly factor BamB